MFRDNEASLLGEVLAKRQANDRAGAVAAAVQLWLAPMERPAEPDGAALETWRAIGQLDAIGEAVSAGLAAIRGKQLVRAHAFIDVIERVEDPEALLGLARLVLDQRWPVHPYLASVFFALVDGKHEDALWDFIKTNRERLRNATPEWVLVGLILTTSRIGKRSDLADWFGGFETRADVPMWIVVAYMASLMQGDHSTKHLVALARASAACVPDESAGFLLALVMLGELLDQRDAEFFAMLRGPRAQLIPALDNERHPLVRYMNAAKHTHAVGADDFFFSMDDLKANVGFGGLTGGLAGLALRTQGERPMNWRVVTLVREPIPYTINAARLFPILDEFEQVERGSKRAVEVYREMMRSKPSDLSSIMPAWRRLEKQKLGWFTRLRLAYF